MRYTRKGPCKNCPFRNDRPGYLSTTRAQEIATNAISGGTFPCHKTTQVVADEEDGERVVVPSTAVQCGGALVFAENVGKGREGGPGCHSNQMHRLASRLLGFNPDDLQHDAPVFDSLAAMVEANKGNGR